MTASKDKILNVWQVPKQWIKEEAPDEAKDDEEEKFRTKKLKNILEEQKVEEVAERFEEDFKVETKKEDKAFQNIEKGFDPLGGGMVKSKPVTEDDDLAGWYN